MRRLQVADDARAAHPAERGLREGGEDEEHLKGRAGEVEDVDERIDKL